MMRLLTIVTVAAVAVFAGSTGAVAQNMQPPETTETVFVCKFYKNANGPDESAAALRLSREKSNFDGPDKWTVQRSGGDAVKAEPFSASFGSVGGSQGLSWKGVDGQQQKAFISYSDIVDADQPEVFWLGMNRPSLWQPPGYLCEALTPEDGVSE